MSLIFGISFFLNLVWENLHSLLYAHYQGGEITEFILLRATLSDAIYILLLASPFILYPKLKSYNWLIIPLGICLSIAIEWYALGTGRWAYGEHMPMIPFLNVGLTPAIQLGLLGYISYILAEKADKKMGK